MESSLPLDPKTGNEPLPPERETPAHSGSNAFCKFLGSDGPARLGKRDALINLVGWPVLLAIFFVPLIVDGSALSSFGRDVAKYWMPLRQYLGQTLTTFDIRFLNPYQMSGTPFLASGQSGIFFPPNWLFAVMPVHWGLNLQTLAGFWFGLSSMYLVLRRIGNSLPASVIGSMIFSFSGFAVLHWFAGHLVFVTEWPLAAFAVLCWIVLQERLTRNDLKGGAWPTLALSALLSLQIFGGHPQIVYFTLLILGILQSGWLVFAIKAGARRQALIGILYLVAALLMTAGLTAVQTFPLLLYSRETVRAANIDLKYYLEQSLRPSNLVTIFAPWAWRGIAEGDEMISGESFWEVNAYIGAGACVLLLAGLALWRRISPLQWTMVAMTGFGILVAMGRYTPFYELARHIVPGMSMFRTPGRFLFLFTFAASVLTARGLDELRIRATLSGRHFRETLLFPAVLVVAGAAVFAWLYWEGSKSIVFLGQVVARKPRDLVFSPEVFARIFRMYSGALIIAFVIAGLTIIAASFHARRHLANFATVTVCSIVVLELVIAAWPFRESFRLEDRSWPRRIVEVLRRLEPQWRFGSSAWGYSHDFNLATQIGVRHIWGYEPTMTMRYCETMHFSQYKSPMREVPISILIRKPTPFLNALAMRYVLCSPDNPLPDSNWKIVVKAHKLWLYENLNAIARGFIVTKAEVVSPPAAPRRVNAPDFDIANVVLLETEPEQWPSPSTQVEGTTGSVKVLRDDPEHYSAEISMRQDGFFVLMDQLLPGWTAKLDGKPTRLYRANSVGRAVAVPPGTHRVTMDYVAPGFRAGATISGISWLLWLAAIGWNLVRRKQPEGSGRRSPAPEIA